MADRNLSVYSTSGRKKSVAQNQVTSVLSGNELPVYTRELTADEEVLAALGYKPEFKREFSLWTSFCVSFAVLGLLPSFASTLYFGMGYAGTAGMVWGWLIAMTFIQCVAMGMAEICSSMPTSGGLYYASAVLAPPGWGPLAAWITGWSNWLAQVTGAPSVDYAREILPLPFPFRILLLAYPNSGTTKFPRTDRGVLVSAMILAAASINQPDYTPTDYQTFLLTTLIMLIHGVISSMPTKWLAQFNSVGSTFNILALFIVIILIPAANTRADQGLPRFTSAADVWGTIYAGTDFPAGISILMSFVAVIWTMSGYDAPFHLSEECSNANIASPRAIVLTSGIGGLFGWFLQLVVAYTVVDIDAVLDSDLGQPWAAYLLQVLSTRAATAVLGLTIVCGFSMGQGCMVAASRVTFAYARDGCFPGSWWIGRVNQTVCPLNPFPFPFLFPSS